MMSFCEDFREIFAELLMLGGDVFAAAAVVALAYFPSSTI